MDITKHTNICDCPGCELSLSLLDILNSGSEIKDTMQGIVRVIKSSAGFGMVGLRLIKGDDFPIYCSDGMNSVFVAEENSVALKGENGQVVANEFGQPSYECLCGMVISGRRTQDNCFTDFGSFWTNDLQTLKNHATAIPALNIRHACISAGYRSLALIPVKVNSETVGLLHIGDKRPDVFNPSTVRFLERAAVSIGVAFARMKRIDTTHENLNFTAMLIETVPVAIFYKSRDGRYLGCNSAFEKLTGLSKAEVLGKSVYEIAPKSIADIYYQQDMELFLNPGSQIYESTVKRPDGSFRNVIFHKSTFNHADGAVAGLIGGILDITDSKEKINILQSVNEFSREIVHEINNIILVVKGNSQFMLGMDDDYREWKQDTQSILDSMKRAELLVAKIREFNAAHKAR